MRSKSVKPSAYPKLPFHGIRFIVFLSSAVTAIILAVFIYHLHADGYKLPFAFLIVSQSQHIPIPTSKLTNTETIAPHRLPPLHPKCLLHIPHQLHLRPLHQTLHNTQHPSANPMATRPRPPKLQHGPHNPNILQHPILGRQDRHLSLSRLQGPLRFHGNRHRILHRFTLAGCHCAPSREPFGRL